SEPSLSSGGGGSSWPAKRPFPRAILGRETGGETQRAPGGRGGPLRWGGRPPSRAQPLPVAGYKSQPPGNGGAAAKGGAHIFKQLEAILDSTEFTAEQKCLLVKVRCRVNSRTLTDAIVSVADLLRAASLRDRRALRGEMRRLRKSGAITRTERPGRASV